jgi:hypothetical protein
MRHSSSALRLRQITARALDWAFAPGGDENLGAVLTADAYPVFYWEGRFTEFLAWADRSLALGERLADGVRQRLRVQRAAARAMIQLRPDGDDKAMWLAHDRVTDRAARIWLLFYRMIGASISGRLDFARAARAELTQLCGEDHMRALQVCRSTELVAAHLAETGQDAMLRDRVQALLAEAERTDFTTTRFFLWMWFETDEIPWSSDIDRAILTSKRYVDAALGSRVLGALGYTFLGFCDRLVCEYSLRNQPGDRAAASALIAALVRRFSTDEVARFLRSGLALLALASDRPRDAARILGRRPGNARSPCEDNLRTALSQALSPAELADALAEGASWTHRQAIDLALGAGTAEGGGGG